MGQQEEDEEAQESEDGDQVDGPVRRRGPDGHRLRRLLVLRLCLLVGGHAQAGGPPGRRPQGEALHCGGGGGDFSFFFSVGGDAGGERGGGVEGEAVGVRGFNRMDRWSVYILACPTREVGFFTAHGKCQHAACVARQEDWCWRTRANCNKIKL